MDELNLTRASEDIEPTGRNNALDKPLSEIEQEQAGQHQKQTAIAEAEKKESQANRKSTIQAFIVETDFLGLDPRSDGMMESMTKALISIEGKLQRVDPTIDVTTKPGKLLQMMLKQELAKNKANLERIATERFGNFYEELVADRTKSTLEKIQLLAGNDSTHKATRNKLKDYIRVVSLAQTPEDKAALEQKINVQNLANLPNPIGFIQEHIFGDPEITGISKATQVAIAKEFNITAKKINSGTDLDNALGEKAVNPETGEEEYVYNENNKLTYRPGLSSYTENETGNRMVTAELPDGRDREFDVTGWSRGDLTELSEYLVFWRSAEEAGISHALGESFNVDMGLLDHFEAEEARKSRQTIEAMVGFNQGYDGRIMSEGNAQFLKWEFQAFSPKGDWAQGDYDIASADKGLQDLGIKDKAGNLNYDVLKGAGSFLRGVYGSGTPDYYDLQLYLHALYGGQVPLTGENQQENN